MAKRSYFTPNSGVLLQVSLGLFFLALGVMGLGDYNSRINGVARFFGREDSLRVVVAVVELVMGVLLVLSLFLSMSSGIARIFWVCLFGLWALFILYYFVFNGLFKPDFVPWLYEVAWRCVILAGLWIVGKRAIN